MSAERRFPPDQLEAFRAARILGVRAGGGHRHTGVWVVVVEGRVFVRSWNDKPAGWYRAFSKQPRGRIHYTGGELDVRARQTRNERLRKAVSAAYAAKYDTKASAKWVTGFAEPERERNTLEFVPVGHR